MKLLILVPLISTVILAHGDADWIRKVPSTSWCCGVKDCSIIEKDDIKYMTKGWNFRNPYNGRVESVSFGQEYMSIDKNYWACFNINAKSKPLRCNGDESHCCFFAPQPGV